MKKNEKETSRASSTRSKTERPKVWAPPSSLDAPPAPDGFRHRWLRSERKYKGIIGVGGLVLARIPTEIAQQRVDYQKTLTEGQDKAVEHDLMRDQHKSMPIDIDRQSRVTFGGTKKS